MARRSLGLPKVRVDKTITRLTRKLWPGKTPMEKVRRGK